MMLKCSFTDKCVIALSLSAVAIWAYPMWFTPGMTGIGDWDFAMHRFEAIRLTVSEFKQWPGHNPWITGGVPLLGLSAKSLLSIQGLLVLAVGSYWGLRLGVLIYLCIGFIGAWKLSGIWWRDQYIKLMFCFYLIANPAMIFHITVGHLTLQTFWLMPMLFYFLLRFKEDKWSGLKAAIVLSVAFNDSPNYIVQYGMLILFCLYIYLFVRNYEKCVKALLRWLMLFVPIVIALTFYRAITILPIAIDYSRISNIKFHYEWLAILKAYLYPFTKCEKIVTDAFCANTWEVCSYVGIIGCLLALVGLRLGFRWWHAMIIGLVWAGMGNDSYFHIMYWIQKIPSFSSHLCFTRISIFTPLFFGIAAIWGLSYLWSKFKDHNIRVFRYLVTFIGILTVTEVLAVSHMIMKSGHVQLDSWSGAEFGYKFQNVSSLPRPKEAPEIVNITFRAIKMNLGWLRGYGDSNLPGNTARIGRDEPGYVGEFHQNGRAVEPVYWSPNRILLEGLDPHSPLVVNMNPGNPWYNNGRQLFPQYRIVEMLEPFEVMPDENGVVELTYRYPGQKLAIFGTIFWVAVSVVVVVVYRSMEDTRTKHRSSGPQTLSGKRL